MSTREQVYLLQLEEFYRALYRTEAPGANSPEGGSEASGAVVPPPPSRPLALAGHYDDRIVPLTPKPEDIANPHLMLHDVYANTALFKPQEEDAEERSVPHVFTKNNGELGTLPLVLLRWLFTSVLSVDNYFKICIPSTIYFLRFSDAFFPSGDETRDRRRADIHVKVDRLHQGCALPIVWMIIDDKESHYNIAGMLAGLDWTYLFAAGGSVLGCLLSARSPVVDRLSSVHFFMMQETTSSFEDSDIDLFLHGVADGDDDKANDVLKHLVDVIVKNTGATGAARSSPLLVLFRIIYSYDIF